MYRNRSVDLRGDRRLRYILIFKNYGRSAGASLEHAHSQLIALPIIPKRVGEELTGAAQYYEYRDRCVFCDILQQEMSDRDRLVTHNQHYVAFAPYVSSVAFETWILPRAHRSDFCYIEREEITDLARIIRETLLRLRLALGDPPYNLILHSAPIEREERPDYHWHIEIAPKLTGIAGFEWGTGFYIAPTPPELAARYLRDVRLG
jgi:UDPglucose--hexose-1-phosphate uridylyltransferase